MDIIEGILENVRRGNNNSGCLPLLFLGCFFLCLIGLVLDVMNASISDILKPGLGFGGWCFIGAAICLLLAMITSERL